MGIPQTPLTAYYGDYHRTVTPSTIRKLFKYLTCIMLGLPCLFFRETENKFLLFFQQIFLFALPIIICLHAHTHFSIILFYHISSRFRSLKSVTALLWTTSVWSTLYLECPKLKQIVLLRPSWCLQQHYPAHLYPNTLLENFARTQKFFLLLTCVPPGPLHHFLQNSCVSCALLCIL